MNQWTRALSNSGRVLIALAAVPVAGCAVGGTTDGGDASEAGHIDGAVDVVMDTGTDVPPAMDVFACTGSTCTIANGTGRCVSGVCEVGMCSTGSLDMDHDARNGCECVIGVVGSSCAMATDLGMLSPGSMHLVQSLLPAGASEQWVRATFAPGGRIHVEFATNPGTAYHFDVAAACTPSTHVTCPDRMEGGSAVTAFEFFDTTPDAGMPRTDLPMRMSAYPTMLYIHVTTTRPATTCEPYTLVVGNDVW